MQENNSQQPPQDLVSFKRQVKAKDPAALSQLAEFSRAALGDDSRARQIVDYIEKKPILKFESKYDEGGTLELDPYLTNELRDLLNKGHKLELDKVKTVEGAIKVLEDELTNQRSAARSLGELFFRVKEEKKANIQSTFEIQKTKIKVLAQMKYRLKKLLVNKSE